ncbi:MAG TPA: apolipoprotein N-acyltransferase [Terrimesophilobacter sp.]|nr:apolipoprotein N-acyltransferase [Terrimesophilobacter sp.]
MPLPLALLAAALSGLLVSVAFPGFGLWPLSILGSSLLLWSLRNRSLRDSIWVGLVGGAFYWGPLIDWLTVYLGPIPWLALAGVQTLFFTAGAVLLTLAWRWLELLWRGALGRVIGIPTVLASLLTLREAVTAVWPYGGFSWGRLAFAHSESWFSPVAAWVGASGLSWVVAFVAAVVLQAVRERSFDVTVRGTIVTAVVAAVLAVPAFPGSTAGELRVAAVQGDSDAGLFAQYERGEILADHIAATQLITDEQATGVDVVVWPENSSDLNPLWYPQAARQLDTVSARFDAPLVTGTITQDAEERIFNSLLLWEAGRGATDQYDKIHPVPFAEYLPDRDFWYPLAPPLFDMVPRDYSFGQRDNVFTLNGAIAGVAICFDIVDDALLWQMLDDDANIIFAPTNNADFGRTDESAQQLAIARLRAIETHRTVVNISTVGTSAIIAPDGSTIDELPVFEPGVMVETVPLSDTTTLATVLKRTPELAASAFGLGMLLLGGTLARTARTGRNRG